MTVTSRRRPNGTRSVGPGHCPLTVTCILPSVPGHSWRPMTSVKLAGGMGGASRRSRPSGKPSSSAVDTASARPTLRRDSHRRAHSRPKALSAAAVTLVRQRRSAVQGASRSASFSSAAAAASELQDDDSPASPSFPSAAAAAAAANLRRRAAGSVSSSAALPSAILSTSIASLAAASSSHSTPASASAPSGGAPPHSVPARCLRTSMAATKPQ